MTYAADTSVPVERSHAEIERMLVKYGATKFMSGWDEENAAILFTYRDRRVRFTLPLPSLSDPRFKLDGAKRVRRADAIAKAHAQECRARWRALLLVIKAKLEAVEGGIETFEVAFLAHIVLPSGETIGEWAVPQIARAYEAGTSMPVMLGMGSR